MTTMNVSLPEEQIDLVDKCVLSYGFANRSEFIRSLLRLISRHPRLVESAVDFPFVSPTEKSTKKIITEFKKTGKYSEEFLKDLEEGLLASDYFKK